MPRTHLTAVLVCLGVAATIVLIACGGDGSTPQTGFVNTMVSDPPTCSSPNGPYLHVYVTVTDVEIHSSSSGQWVDLTPDLKPKQIDLLGKADTQCFLAMLGSGCAVGPNYRKPAVPVVRCVSLALTTIGSGKGSGGVVEVGP